MRKHWHGNCSPEIAYFLPLVRRTIFSGSRRRHGLVPLFPSYLFISGDALDHEAAVRSDRVSQVIAVDNQRQLLDELATLERVLNGPCNWTRAHLRLSAIA